MKHNNRYNFRLLQSAKKHPECTKVHHFPLISQIIFWRGGTAPSPYPSPCGEGKPFPYMEMKHSNQYNSRLLQSAKIASRMHQNMPFSTRSPKIHRGRGTSPVERGKPPPVPNSLSAFGASILTPSALNRESHQSQSTAR